MENAGASRGTTAVFTGMREVVTVRIRERWMDILRGTSILLVVLYHAESITLQDFGGGIPWLAFVNNVFAPIRMPMMVFLSGMFVQRSMAKGTGHYLSGKIRNVLYPYLVWSAVMLVVFAIASLSVHRAFDTSMIGRVFYDPIEHMWFLAYLFVYFLIALLTRRGHPAIVAGALFALAFVPVGPQWQTFWLLGGFFFIGVVVRRHPKLWQRTISHLTVSIGCTVAAFAAFASMAMEDDAVRYNPYFSPIVVIGIVGVAGLASRIPSGRLTRPIEYVGRHSITFYLVHWPVVILTSGALSRVTDLTAAQAFACCVLFGVLGGYVASVLVTRYRPFHYLISLDRHHSPAPRRAVDARS